MPEQNKLQGMIGLAKRAGTVSAGTPMVCESVRKGKAFYVLIASDATENAKKKVQNCCTYYEIPFVTAPFTTEMLAHIIGKCGVIAAIAITDASFANAICALIPNHIDNHTKPQEV